MVHGVINKHPLEQLEQLRGGIDTNSAKKIANCIRNVVQTKKNATNLGEEMMVTAYTELIQEYLREKP